MNTPPPSLEVQKEAIRRKRDEQCRALVDSGIMSKVMGQIDKVGNGTTRESLPIVLGSTHDGTLCFFVGLELVTPESHTTNYVLVGTKNDDFLPNRAAGFTLEDCVTLDSLFGELQTYSTQLAPAYDLERGVFNE